MDFAMPAFYRSKILCPHAFTARIFFLVHISNALPLATHVSRAKPQNSEAEQYGIPACATLHVASAISFL